MKKFSEDSATLLKGWKSGLTPDQQVAALHQKADVNRCYKQKQQRRCWQHGGDAEEGKRKGHILFLLQDTNTLLNFVASLYIALLLKYKSQRTPTLKRQQRWFSQNVQCQLLAVQLEFSLHL